MEQIRDEICQWHQSTVGLMTAFFTFTKSKQLPRTGAGWEKFEVDAKAEDERLTAAQKGETANEAMRKKHLYFVSCWWSPQVIRHYGIHDFKQRKMRLLFQCVLKWNEFPNFVPVANLVLSLRHLQAVREVNPKRKDLIERSARFKLQDLEHIGCISESPRVVYGRSITRATVVEFWRQMGGGSGGDGTIDLRPESEGHHARHSHMLLLHKDNHGLLAQKDVKDQRALLLTLPKPSRTHSLLASPLAATTLEPPSAVMSPASSSAAPGGTRPPSEPPSLHTSSCTPLASPPPPIVPHCRSRRALCTRERTIVDGFLTPVTSEGTAAGHPHPPAVPAGPGQDADRSDGGIRVCDGALPGTVRLDENAETTVDARVASRGVTASTSPSASPLSWASTEITLLQSPSPKALSDDWMMAEAPAAFSVGPLSVREISPPASAESGPLFVQPNGSSAVSDADSYSDAPSAAVIHTEARGDSSEPDHEVLAAGSSACSVIAVDPEPMEAGVSRGEGALDALHPSSAPTGVEACVDPLPSKGADADNTIGARVDGISRWVEEMDEMSVGGGTSSPSLSAASITTFGDDLSWSDDSWDDSACWDETRSWSDTESSESGSLDGWFGDDSYCDANEDPWLLPEGYHLPRSSAAYANIEPTPRPGDPSALWPPQVGTGSRGIPVDIFSPVDAAEAAGSMCNMDPMHALLHPRAESSEVVASLFPPEHVGSGIFPPPHPVTPQSNDMEHYLQRARVQALLPNASRTSLTRWHWLSGGRTAIASATDDLRHCTTTAEGEPDFSVCSIDTFIRAAGSGCPLTRPVVVKEKLTDQGLHSFASLIGCLRHIPRHVDVRVQSVSKDGYERLSVPDFLDAVQGGDRSLAPIDLYDGFRAQEPAVALLPRFQLLSSSIKCSEAHTGVCRYDGFRGGRELSLSSIESDGAFRGPQVGAFGGQVIRNLVGRQLCMFVPPAAMGHEWNAFAHEGIHWHPRGKQLSLLLEEGDVLYVPHSHVLAWAAVGRCASVAAPLWDERDLAGCLRANRWAIEHPNCARVPPLRGFDVVLDCLHELLGHSAHAGPHSIQGLRALREVCRHRSTLDCAGPRPQREWDYSDDGGALRGTKRQKLGFTQSLTA